MQNSPRLKFFLLSAVFLFVLTGCLDQEKPEEQLYEVMEQAVSAEKQFEEQQEPLVGLETKEKELFDKIIGLGLKEHEKVVQLSDEALALADKRKSHIEEERKSILKSEKIFGRAGEIKDKVENPELKKKAEILYSTMQDRYSAHETLYKFYLEAIEADKKLYTALKDKAATLEQLEGQVVSVNDLYSKVLDANEKFNHLTEEYNNEKLAFYEMAGLGKK